MLFTAAIFWLLMNSCGPKPKTDPNPGPTPPPTPAKLDTVTFNSYKTTVTLPGAIANLEDTIFTTNAQEYRAVVKKDNRNDTISKTLTNEFVADEEYGPQGTPMRYRFWTSTSTSSDNKKNLSANFVTNRVPASDISDVNLKYYKVDETSIPTNQFTKITNGIATILNTTSSINGTKAWAQVTYKVKWKQYTSVPVTSPISQQTTIKQ